MGEQTTYNPHATPKNNLVWIQRSIQEGPFGILTTLDRSLDMEEAMCPTIQNIKTEKVKWKTQILADKNNAETEKDKMLHVLSEQWKTIPKGGVEELEWTEKAIGLSGAFFEDYMRQHIPSFELRDNQLSYLTLLVLGKGKYDFGFLEEDKRGVELPTGEGKTYGFGLASVLFAMKGEQVIVVEPNYVSAQNHAAQIGGFIEHFLHESIGVVTDLAEKREIVQYSYVDNKGNVNERAEYGEGRRKSYRYINGLLRDLPGREGRRSAWKNKIVFADRNSVAFDQLDDRNTSKENQTGQPNLGKCVALVAEADESMIDSARNPWIISESIKGDSAWEAVVDMMGFLDEGAHEVGVADSKAVQLKVEELKKDPEEALTFAVNTVFSLWREIDISHTMGKFVEGDGKDYYNKNRELALSDRAMVKGEDILALILMQKGLLNCSEGEARTFINNHPGMSHTLFIALKVHFGVNEMQDYIQTKDNPVLLDQYGFPLDRQQYSDAHQLFMQLKTMWKKTRPDGKSMEILHKENVEYMTSLEKEMQLNTMLSIRATQNAYRMKYASAALQAKHKIRASQVALNKEYGDFLKDAWSQIQMSQTADQIYAPELFNSFGTLRVSSGSLVPAAPLLHDVYGVETFKVSRHNQPDFISSGLDSYPIKCLDGGVAEVLFCGEAEKYTFIQDQAQSILDKGRMGLIIMPDVLSASALAKQIPGAVLVTANEEYAERGKLDMETTQGALGKIIITTQMAHRDVDLKIPQKVRENGGPVCIVCGQFPTERGLWQGLQRVGRGDIPGTRLLILTDEDMNAIADTGLTQPGETEKLYQRRKAKIQQLWAKEQKTHASLHEKNKVREALLGIYIQHHKLKEEQIRHQLVNQSIHYGSMGFWRDALIKRLSALPVFSAAIEDIVSREPWPLSFGPILREPPGPGVEAYKKLHTQIIQGKIRDFVESRERRSILIEFQGFVDDEFRNFMADSRNTVLPPVQIRERWKAHMWVKLDDFIGRIKDFNAEWQPKADIEVD